MAIKELATKKGRLLPAYPLFVKDPYFSIWAPADTLNGGDTIFWTGMRRRLLGVVYADGKAYSFMGLVDRTERLTQTKVELTAFTTKYEFTCADFDLCVTFTSPLPPDDPMLLSTPVCFFDYTVKPHKALASVSVALLLHEESCYDYKARPVHGGVHELKAGESAWLGAKKQMPLSHSADDCAADWGYWYLTGQKAMLFSAEGLDVFNATGKADFVWTETKPKYIMAYNVHENVSAEQKGMLSLAFDDTVSIFYFGDWLKGYWTEGGRTIFDAIEESHRDFGKIAARLDAFDKDLKRRAEAYGEDYLLVLYAGLRESIGAHKLVKSREGELLFLSKECHSNGCIATVDVSYPSVPLYLLYNPELVKGMLRPIFKFAGMHVWSYDFAPHDVGTYPYCLGQIYAYSGITRNFDKKYTDHMCHAVGSQPEDNYTYPLIYQFPGNDYYNFNKQMPVEESGNMLIMTAAALVADGDTSLAEANLPALTSWVGYLVKYGLMPGSQLCTDDFAGHLDKNINLSVKAIVGIRAYAIILEKLGRADEAKKYVDIAAEYAAEWKKMCCREGMAAPLVFDGDPKETFSLKYNMAFDVMFGTGLFGSDVRETEVDRYIAECNEFGVPLDSRDTYTKSDWILWSASLTDDIEKRKALIGPVAHFLRTTPSHCPFTDWYYTDKGTMRGEFNSRGYQWGMKNRSVQGGLFCPLLRDSGILKLNK